MKQVKLSILKTLSKYFEIDFTIKAFGAVILHLHWPPQLEPDPSLLTSNIECDE